MTAASPTQAARQAGAHSERHRGGGGHVQAAPLPAHRHHPCRVRLLPRRPGLRLRVFNSVVHRRVPPFNSLPDVFAQGFPRLETGSVLPGQRNMLGYSHGLCQDVRLQPPSEVIMDGSSAALCSRSDVAAAGYEPTSMRAIRARYNPYVQARGRVDQLRKLGHSVDKAHFATTCCCCTSAPARHAAGTAAVMRAPQNALPVLPCKLAGWGDQMRK